MLKAADAAYALAGSVATAVWLPWGAMQQARGRTSVVQRLALEREVAGARPVWLHTASVGEANAATPLVRALAASAGVPSLVWTTQTSTGLVRARAASPAAQVLLAPFDAVGAPARFLRRVRPRAALIAETELWPGWLRAADAAGVPVAFVNACMSERSARAYRRASPWVRPALGLVRCVAAQTAADADRFVDCGAPPDTVVVTGNMKWDQQPPASGGAPPALTAWLRATGRAIAVAGSTRPGEEGPVAVAGRSLRTRTPDALLVVAPRHLARLDEAESAIRQAWPGVRLVRWSAARARAAAPDLDALVLDTLGELAQAYAAADVAFVGGTLAPLGGHNVGEPALCGVPVAFGPSTEQCADAASLLLDAGGARCVANGHELAETWSAWLADRASRDAAGAAAARAVESVRGATARTVRELQRRGILPRDGDA